MKSQRTHNCKKATRCCLCGEPIVENPASDDKRRDRAHGPAKQFYPKELRKRLNRNLWAAASHRGCNQATKDAEEHFYCTLWPHVAETNPSFSVVMGEDIKRRATTPQGRALIRSVLANAGPVTKSGIMLPPNMIQWNLDRIKTVTVGIATAQVLSSFHDNQLLSTDACIDFHVCQQANDIPERYNLIMNHTKFESACPQVFSYWRYQTESGLKLYSLLFWDAILLCLTFKTN